ncbi:Broad-complex core protein isoform 6 [Camponotus floridanus]|uniref:Broad-complex core protein isoform 6 n=1 Tax=Camponotus floridanus TaxID=104421 RepID=E2A0K9_CAMFO|nr:Broad-complex core protein isoform 6 [Camponotus floridanus]
MSSQICLKWNSFLSNIATSFESLWEEEGLVDVTLASDGQCLTAHKVILSASSPFFKKVFQTNPCQHPVIILQDVHFSELEALLIFIYKGEVNIEQKNLPALLKAAETLQIRGLSGGDIFAKESYKRLAELEQAVAEDVPLIKEETPKKKQKVSKQQNNSILEKALTPRIPQSENTNESAASDQSGKDGEYMLPETLPNPVYHRLEMKIEPLEMAVDDLQKRSPLDKDPTERLDTGQADGNQGSGNSPAEDISGLSGLSGLSGFSDVKPLLYSYQHLPYADLLPSPDIISTWASSRPMDHLACDLMKILFTPEERILCNVNGKMGKQQFDSNKIHLIREVLLHFSGIAPNSIEWEEAWKNCVTKIDTSNRGLKRLKFFTGSLKPIVTVIAEARNTSPVPEMHNRNPNSTVEQSSLWNVTKILKDPPSDSSNRLHFEHALDQPKSSNLFAKRNPGALQSENFFALTESYGTDLSDETIKGGPAYPPFPCPFCDRAYTSWGFRRRHIKAVHTISPSLNCKWCLQILPTHAAWRRHVITAHNLSASDAHNGLLILEEAHMVLQIAHPTRLDTLVNIIKQSSQQKSCSHDNAHTQSDKD